MCMRKIFTWRAALQGRTPGAGARPPAPPASKIMGPDKGTHMTFQAILENGRQTGRFLTILRVFWTHMDHN